MKTRKTPSTPLTIIQKNRKLSREDERRRKKNLRGNLLVGSGVAAVVFVRLVASEVDEPVELSAVVGVLDEENACDPPADSVICVVLNAVEVTGTEVDCTATGVETGAKDDDLIRDVVVVETYAVAVSNCFETVDGVD